MILRVILGMALFLGSLAVGWWLQSRGVLTEASASRLVRFIVMGPSPLVLCLSFWRMDLTHWEPWLLPLLGAVISCATLLPGVVYARRAALTNPQTGSFLTCALFSNLGYLGAFTAFALFGEVAYGLCMLYLVFFTPAFYSLGFWIGTRYGHPAGSSEMASAYNSELRLYPFLGMLIGALLSLFQVQGLPRLIVLLQASTPVAVSPMVLPLLFGLDRQLANALWLFTTLLAIPWLLLIIPILQRL